MLVTPSGRNSRRPGTPLRSRDTQAGNAPTGAHRRRTARSPLPQHPSSGDTPWPRAPQSPLCPARTSPARGPNHTCRDRCSRPARPPTIPKEGQAQRELVGRYTARRVPAHDIDTSTSAGRTHNLPGARPQLRVQTQSRYRMPGVMPRRTGSAERDPGPHGPEGRLNPCHTLSSSSQAPWSAS
jgi:hypothetical protein